MSTKLMKAGFVTGPRQIEIMTVPVPEIYEEEVLIKVLVCGTCYSEYPQWDMANGARKQLGHEPVGIVETVGSRVNNVKPGDRVTGMIYQAYAEYTKAHFSKVIAVPDGLPDEQTVGEPLSCLMSGAERTQVSLGDTVAIIGSGYMGLGFMQLMKLKGAAKIIGIDIRREGLEHAKRFGAAETYFPEEVPAKYIVDEWNEEMFQKGTDVVAEVTGTQPGLDIAGKMTRISGILSIVGYHQNAPRMVDMKLWNWKAITVINAHERRDDYHMRYMAAALRLIEANRLDVKNLMTHEFKLSEINKAFEAMKSKPEGYIKGFVRINTP